MESQTLLLVSKTIRSLRHSLGGHGSNIMGVLFWFLLKSIISSLIGKSFYKWFQKTKYGVWWDAKVSTLLNKVTGKHEQAVTKKAQIDMFDNL